MKKQITFLMMMSFVLMSCGEAEFEVLDDFDQPVGVLRECPDEHIYNREPGTSGEDDLNRHYYIVDGARKEMSEYDVEWVENNCDIAVQEVW